MAKFIKSEDWQPSNDIILTEESKLIVKETNENVAILAGPGTGKTEILAQRASFLLQTGQCKYPYRILALCFKKDAARNLRIRVKKRCDKQLAHRFDAYTFDGFCYSIASRFSTLLPVWTGFQGKLIPLPMGFDRNWLDEHSRSFSRENMRLQDITYEIDLISSPSKGSDMYTLWKYCAKKNMLSYEMVFAFAYTLIRSKPQVKELIRATYQHIFLDEFQDTTDEQYQLLKEIASPNTRLVAVGDEGQRIMVWAGAKPQIFETFIKDYQANKNFLTINHRSNKEIVDFINHVLKTFFNSDISYESTNGNQNSINPIKAYQGSEESCYISNEINQYIAQNPSLGLHDIAVIIKQKAADYHQKAEEIFQKNNIALRNEDEKILNTNISIQDLMSDPLSQLYILSLRKKYNVISSEQNLEWAEMLTNICGYDLSSDRDAKKLNNTQNNILNACKEENISTQEQLKIVIDTIGGRDIKNHCFYKNDSILQNHINAICQLLQQSIDRHGNDIKSALDAYEGINQVKLMTIHKSKGLEFDTVFFVEMHEKSWWSNKEAKECFFVGLSRAKTHLYFTSDRPFHRDFAKCLKEYGISTVTTCAG